MSNQLEKLKNSIKKEYTKSFELNLMKSSGFIPVDKRQTEFFVILNKNCVSNKSQIEGLFKEKFAGLTPKFIPVSVMVNGLSCNQTSVALAPVILVICQEAPTLFGKNGDDS